MSASSSLLAARGLTDAEDRLLSADQPLAELQERCGGTIPGTLAVPELLDLVRQGRTMGLRLAREFSAFDGVGKVTAFVRINPLSGAEDGAVCELLVENWQRDPGASEDERETAARLDEIDRATAELVARLDSRQRLLAVDCDAPDLATLLSTMRRQPGKPWSDYVQLVGIAHRQPLHWRLLDGARCRIEGSQRDWRARLLPVGGTGTADPSAFELLLVADQPLVADKTESAAESRDEGSLIGEALTPALRQPISRIIANAETIRTRLAGPLRQEYSDYAADISSAGQHLATLLDDLADLEVVEAADFSAAKDRLDLADAARRAAGILGVRAREKQIAIELPEGEALPALGEFRRVLQIMLNLIGNAINYSPEDSKVRISIEPVGADKVAVRVSDEGPGMGEEQRARVFNKFERLGREGDGGSGLGLYIAKRLALAMDGDLDVASEAGQGACFSLTLPRAS